MVAESDFKGVFDSTGVTARVNGQARSASFQNEFRLIEDVERQVPVLRLFASAAGGVSHGDPVTVNGDDYTVRSIEPGRDGIFTRLLLQQAAPTAPPAPPA